MNRQITADDITFEEPPEVVPFGGHRGRRSLCAPDVAEKLRANPGQWALLRATAKPNSAMTTAIRRGKGGLGPGFDACTRKLPDGTYALYARYVG